MDKTQINTRKRKKSNFKDDDKRMLATLVKEHPAIWDATSTSHRSINVMNNAWREISLSMCRPIEECKYEWRSLKDGFRYRKRRQEEEKCNNSLDNYASDVQGTSYDDDIPDWSLRESLQFLESDPKKRTFSRTKNTSGEFPSNEYLCSNQTTGEEVNFKKKRKHASVSQQLLTSLNNYIQMKAAMKEEENLKYYAMYSNIDEMLQKLEEEDVLDLNVQFLSMIVKKMKNKKTT